MGEYKRKFGAYAAWNYEREIEDLNRMSEQGWQLIKGGCFTNKFKRNTEVQYRYQLDFQPDIEVKGRYIETFREQGWEYINSMNCWHYFRKLYDPEQPEEQYEIFTDRESRKEMNNRWAGIGIVLSVIWGYGFVRQLFHLICFPSRIVLLRLVYLGVILAVFLRGVLVMKRPESSKKGKADRWLILGLILWLILGFYVITNQVDNRPAFSMRNVSEFNGALPKDLENSTEWLAFEVQYEDNYYLDLEGTTSAPLCISLVDENKNVIYSITTTECDEENIRLRLKKGKYSIYFSDFAGGSIEMKATLR